MIAAVAPAAPAPAIATSMVAALVIAAVATIIASIVTLVALMRTGGDGIVTLIVLLDAIAILIAGAVVAFHGIIIVLVAGGGILAVIVGYGGGHWSGVIGDLASKRFPGHENAQQADRGRYQQRELFHRCLRFHHASQRN
ncbi:MAG: hypothetical protein EKK31_10735 [Hyphomicrobiales bacterium]|nr:MAG: hypothetical protein EKK31_10735 [Hyphomicrobiales bacterium]